MATDYKGPKQVAIPVLTPDRVNKRQNGRRMKTDGEPMFTLTSQDRHGVGVLATGVGSPSSSVSFGDGQNLTVRKLTPREYWRLQGFPDWAFDRAREVNSNTQLYKQAGNSVTFNVIAAIASRLAVVS